jgi:hypothetical protein
MVDWRLSTGILGQGREEKSWERKKEKDGKESL